MVGGTLTFGPRRGRIHFVTARLPQTGQVHHYDDSGRRSTI